MDHRVAIGGETYRLPALTMALASKRDKAKGEKNQQARWRAEFEFCKAVFGDRLQEVVGSAKLDSCDLVALSTAFLKVDSAYDAPRVEAEREATSSIVSQLDADTVEQLERVAKVIDSLGKSRQGFEAVR